MNFDLLENKMLIRLINKFFFTIQCFPIFALMFYVLAHQNALHTTTIGDMQPRRILFGLASCCLGDYLLTSKETFLQGVGAFALGHIFYIR